MLKIHFTANDYMIIFVLCSILLYIQNFESYLKKYIFSIIINWLVLFSTKILVQFSCGTMKRE